MKPLALALVSTLLAVGLPSLAEARGAIIVNSPVVSQGVIVTRPSGFFTTPIGPGTTFSNTVVTPFATIITTQPFVTQQIVAVAPRSVFVVPRSVFVQPLTVFSVPQGTVFTGGMGTVFVTQ